MPRQRTKKSKMYARLRTDQMRRAEEALKESRAHGGTRARADGRRGGVSRAAGPVATRTEDVDVTMDDRSGEVSDGAGGVDDVLGGGRVDEAMEDEKDGPSSSSEGESISLSKDEPSLSDGDGYDPTARNSNSPKKLSADTGDKESSEKDRTPSQNPPPPPQTPARARNVPAGTPRTPSGRVIRNGAHSEEYIMAFYSDAVERRR
ncbi:hypothetical protein P7C73_g5822, partial [Tremellales sp. Uapishka_1]